MEVTWDIAGSPSLSDAQRERLRRRLGNRIDGRGVLHVASDEHRSQWRNRRAATARLAELVAEALAVRRPRKPTAPPPAAIERRLAEKKRRAETRRRRGPVDPET